jgi:hypothetical protein
VGLQTDARRSRESETAGRKSSFSAKMDIKKVWVAMFCCKTWLCVLTIWMISSSGTEGLKFTDRYEVDVSETPASDADVPPPNPLPPPTNVNVECIEDDGIRISDHITYSIIEGATQLFSFNPATRLFSVSEDYQFDYEQQPWFIVTIQCNLTSDPSRYGNGIVNISVGSVNEYRPTLEVPAPIVVPETTQRGTTIAAPDVASGALGIFTVNDRDSGPDGVITYSFEIGNEDDSLFEVNQVTGTITLDADLDVDNHPEGREILSVSIVACNSGLELDSCEARSLTVYITPANDILPQFNETVYTASLNESAPNGTLVLQVLCVDGDTRVGEVQSISYGNGASNETLSTFEVEFDQLSTSANVSLLSELDYETTTSYRFSLDCSDGVHTATTQVTVDVLPVNDNRPQFEEESYKFSVNRAAPVPSDTLVGTVRAIDADSEVGGTITYSLSSDKFSIDSETGEISLKDYLSAGDGNTFDFDVIASDGEYEASAGVRVSAEGLLSVLEWVYVGIGGFVLLVISVVIGIIVFHHFIKAASIKTIVKEKYIE